MKSQQQHDRDVARLREQVVQSHPKKSPLALDSHTSNLMRSAEYKQNTKPLALKALNQVIAINPHTMTVLVEPRVSMEQLHREVYKHGFLVPVMPEFKGITVGGAINGAAIESSSFRDGQFNDICTGYEILLGGGTVIWATPTHHADLFYAVPGSYGSFGIITCVEIKLIPAAVGVKLRYHPCSEIGDALKLLRDLKEQQDPPDYLEGIVYSPNQTLIIEGRRQETRPRSYQSISLDKPWSPWFYQHVQKYTGKPQEEFMPITDYLFRHDRGAFWMGAYATQLKLFLRYSFEGILQWKSLFSKWDTPENIAQFAKIKNPGFLYRSLSAPFMSSQKLYGLLHSNTENWFENKFVIQDFYIPESKAEKFINSTMSEEKIFPIWLCPVRPTTQPQWFSPHYQMPLPGAPPEDLIDIGLYGLPQGNPRQATRRLEKLTTELGGRKMLYSHSYYSPAEFWSIYPQKEYHFLRHHYHANGAWLDLDAKVLKWTERADKIHKS